MFAHNLESTIRNFGRVCMKKNITIRDVARETGVHVSTVSRALSKNASTSLSKVVVEKIKAKAAEMGYRPNLVASGLRTRKTMSIGIIIPDIGNAVFPPIVRGVESILEPAGYASILVNTDNDPSKEKKFIQVLMAVSYTHLTLPTTPYV